MNSKLTLGVWSVLLGASVGGTALAAAGDNPYQVISAHNPFALRPAVAAQEPARVEPPAAPQLQIFLTGVSSLSLLGPVAILEFTDPQTKKTDRPPPLRVGDKYNERITVAAIDVERGWVRINDGGVETTLDFQRNGIKERPSVSPPPLPAIPRLPTPGNVARPGLVGGGATPGAAPPVLSREEVLARLERVRASNPPPNPAAGRGLPQPHPGP